MTKQEADQVGAFMRDFWPFMKRYWAVEDADSFWDGFLDEADALVRKYEGISTAKALVIAYIRDREEKWKNEQAAKKAGSPSGESEG